MRWMVCLLRPPADTNDPGNFAGFTSHPKKPQMPPNLFPEIQERMALSRLFPDRLRIDFTLIYCRRRVQGKSKNQETIKFSV